MHRVALALFLTACTSAADAGSTMPAPPESDAPPVSIADVPAAEAPVPFVVLASSGDEAGFETTVEVRSPTGRVSSAACAVEGVVYGARCATVSGWYDGPGEYVIATAGAETYFDAYGDEIRAQAYVRVRDARTSVEAQPLRRAPVGVELVEGAPGTGPTIAVRNGSAETIRVQGVDDFAVGFLVTVGSDGAWTEVERESCWTGIEDLDIAPGATISAGEAFVIGGDDLEPGRYLFVLPFAVERAAPADDDESVSDESEAAYDEDADADEDEEDEEDEYEEDDDDAYEDDAYEDDEEEEGVLPFAAVREIVVGGP